MTRSRDRYSLSLTEGVPFDRPPETTTVSDEQEHVNSAYTGKSIITGYLGPTSFASALCEDVDFSSDDRNLERKSPSRVLPSFWVQKISDVLLALANFSPIEAVIRDYCKVSQASVIPGPFILNSLAAVGSMTKDLLPTHNTRDLRGLLTRKLIQNTAKTFEIPSSATGADFHLLYTGQAIRLEIIGVICALAGRAAYLGLAGDEFDNEKQRLYFSRKMLIASDATLHICKTLTSVNDLTIWLVHENFLFSDIANGNSSGF